ncbi:MAG: hypothetical protein ABFS35_13575 [Bacteroidota bacterium]
MKETFIILTATLFITQTAIGQNLFFIGENSYPSTKTITLEANSTSIFIYNLNVVLAKDGTTALIAVSTRISSEVYIGGKLIVYLDDGAVIICNERIKFDYVDNTAKSVYHLTNEDLSKMKNSNINTVRYELQSFGSNDSDEGNYSATNKGTPTKTLITKFFVE